ncbi:MAG: CPBP family intramembrane metalloprotease [Lachnospiraceae bacterium]|nr:CPBP family intramembrane metalloprotease [Lachnospiraceae bacterium]
MELKFRQIIRGFLPIVVIFLVQNVLVFLVAGTMAYFFLAGSSTTDPTQLTNALYDHLNQLLSTPEFNTGISVAYGVVCSLIFGVWYWRMRKPVSHDHFIGYRFWVFPGALMLAMALQYLTGYITEVASLIAPSWAAEYEVLLDSMGMAEESVSVWLIFYTVILAPITEELCFRGLTYAYLRRGVSMWSAVVIQALLFAGFHGNFYQASYTLVFGLFMGYVYAKSENIYLTIGMHVVYNAIAMFGYDLVYLGDGPVSFYCILLTTMMACYVSVLLITRSLPALVEKRKDDK